MNILIVVGGLLLLCLILSDEFRLHFESFFHYQVERVAGWGEEVVNRFRVQHPDMCHLLWLTTHAHVLTYEALERAYCCGVSSLYSLLARIGFCDCEIPQKGPLIIEPIFCGSLESVAEVQYGFARELSVDPDFSDWRLYQVRWGSHAKGSAFKPIYVIHTAEGMRTVTRLDNSERWKLTDQFMEPPSNEALLLFKGKIPASVLCPPIKRQQDGWGKFFCQCSISRDWREAAFFQTIVDIEGNTIEVCGYRSGSTEVTIMARSFTEFYHEARDFVGQRLTVSVQPFQVIKPIRLNVLQQPHSLGAAWHESSAGSGQSNNLQQRVPGCFE